MHSEPATLDGTEHASRFALVPPALFFLSASVLSFEVALLRVFSVILNYHFVFAILSAALLGLGIGGMIHGRRPQALSRWNQSAVAFAILVAISVLVIVSLPVSRMGILAGGGFWIYLALAALPFAAAGYTIAGIFQRYIARASWLYGADLLGAAVGALSVVPLLDAFGGVKAIFFAAAAAGLAAVLLGLSRQRIPIPALGALVALLALVLLVTVGGVKVPVAVGRDPNKEMYQFLNNPSLKARIVDSRWSSFGRTDLLQCEQLPNEMALFVDGAAGSTMYRLESMLNDPQEAAHVTLHYGEFFPLLFLKPEQKRSALVIGPGGGRDVVVALLGQVQSITAVEVNPDIVELVRSHDEFSGGIYSTNPKVTTIVAEGRSYVRSADKRYDLIMLALPITKSSRSVEGYALTENYLFTVEAFGDYLDHLTSGGRLIIVGHQDAEIYRLISLAVEAFRRRGSSAQEAMKHIYTIGSDMPTVVIKGEPLSRDEADTIHKGMHAYGFDRGSFFVPYAEQVTVPADTRLGIDRPLRMFDQILIDISAGRLSMSALARAASIDIGPVTDDRPFFYKFERGLPSPFGAFAFLLAASAGALTILLALRGGAARGSAVRGGSATFIGALRRRPPLKLLLLVFSLLGTGYMLVEVAMFQKLMLYVGQPQYALTVLLFSLLLGGGVGSFASSLVSRRAARAACAITAGVAIAVVAIQLALPGIASKGLEPRVAGVVLLVPLGVLMGFPFPLALRLMDSFGFDAQVPIMWGVNGVGSVCGSALAMMIGMTMGFSSALALGSVLYAGAAALFLALGSEAVGAFAAPRAGREAGREPALAASGARRRA